LYSQRVHDITLFIIITLLHIVTTSFSIFLITHNKGLIIWLPSGCTLAVLLIFGLRFWPAIASGVFISSILAGLPFISALGIVFSVTIAAVITAYLLLRLNFHSTLEHGRDVFLLLMGTLLYSGIGPSIAIIGQSIGGVIPQSNLGNRWLIMWLGDITSLIVVVPVLLVWSRPISLNIYKFRWQSCEAGLFAISLAGCIIYYLNRGFSEFYDFYIFFPFFIWAGLRFGKHGATGSIFLVLLSLTCIYNSSFATNIYSIEHLLSLELTISLVAVMNLILTAIVSERSQAETKLKEINDDLEQRVIERTQALTKEIAERRKIEATLRASEEKFRSIIENSVDGIILIDNNGSILEWNNGLENITGINQNEVMGKSFWEIVDRIIPDEQKPSIKALGYKEYLEKLFNNDIPALRRILKVKILRSDASERTLQMAFFAVKLNQKLLLGGIIRDVTEQEKFADSLYNYAQRLQILHGIDQAILEAKSLNQLINPVLPNLQRLVNSQWVNFITYDNGSKKIIYLGTGIDEQVWKDLVSYFDSGLDKIPPRLNQGELLLINDLQPSSATTPVLKMLLNMGIHTLLSVPLLLQDELNGAILLGAIRANAFDNEQIDIAREVANEIAVAIQQARLIEQIRTGREELRQLAQRVVNIQEEERKRLSRELHDEAGQALIALKIALELILKEIPIDLHSVHDRLAEAVTLTDATMEELRSLARGLRPSALDTVGLNYTLDDLCRDFEKRSNIAIEYHGENLPSSDAESICLYRILQESLTNVYKHAQARHITVTLRQEPKIISLTIQDDGRGFRQTNKEQTPLGIGLLGMKERLTALGGKLIIESQIGHGTQIIARIPREKSVK
jgi:PAS domain S-box-containing protein